MAELNIKAANVHKYYGYNNWQIDVFKNVLDRKRIEGGTVIYKSNAEVYTILKLENKNF